MKSSWFSLFLISAFLLAGCKSSTTKIQQTQGTQLPSSPILLATDTTVPTLTMAHAVTDTETPTETITATPKFTSTSTPIDTLEPEKALETIQPLLKDPLNCILPCFWGITPGSTSYDDARSFFNHLGFIPFGGTGPRSGENSYIISYESSIGRDSSVTFIMANSLVENIIINPEITKQKEGSPREWIAYSPETMIKKFGEPSRVLFNVFRGPNLSNEITMILYFDEDNLIALYSGDNMVPDQPHSPLLCPLTALFDLVTLWMGSNPPNPPVTHSDYDRTQNMLPLEQVTSLTLDQFTQLMLGSPQQACFTINGDMFPN